MRALARCAMAAALGTFSGAPQLADNQRRRSSRVPVQRNRAPPAIIFLLHRHGCRARTPLPVNRVIHVLHTERRQDERIGRRGRAKGRPLPQDRFTELDASLVTRKEHSA